MVAWLGPPTPSIKHCTAISSHYNRSLIKNKKDKDLKARNAVFLINI